MYLNEIDYGLCRKVDLWLVVKFETEMLKLLRIFFSMFLYSCCNASICFGVFLFYSL